MVAVRGRLSGLPGSYCPGLAHLRTAAAYHVQVVSAAPQR